MSMMQTGIRCRILLAGLLGAGWVAAEPAPELLLAFPAGLSDRLDGFVSGRAMDAGQAWIPAAYFPLWSESRQAAVVWVTDGTQTGTHPAAAADASNASGSVFASPSGGAYFAGRTDQTGWQVFRTDGPESSARALTGDPEGVTGILGLMDGMPVFARDEAPDSRSVWRVDGNNGLQHELVNLPTRQVEFAISDQIGFALSRRGAPLNDYQVTSFRVDGSPPLNLPVPPPNTWWDSTHSPGAGTRLACMKSFTHYTPEGQTQELYCSDGTIEGTRRPVPPTQGTGVWLPDGTRYFPLGDRLMFYTRSGQPAGHYTPWVTDGTDEGTIPLLDQSMSGWMPCSDDRFGGAYFMGDAEADDGAGYNLWYTDGTRAGTRPVALVPEYQCNRLGSAVGAGGVTYLRLGQTLYRTDGTTAGTRPVTGAPDLGYHNASWRSQGIAVLGRWLVFLAPVSDTQDGVWRIDLDALFSDSFED